MANIYEGAVEVSRRTLNSAIEEVIPEIRKISAENADAAIKIAVLEFSSGTRWITPAPMDAEDFTWSFLTADGLTDFGAACKQLNEKLSRKAFMSDVAGSFAPAIFLLSDGEPTDEYSSELSKLIRFVSVTASQIGSKSSGVGKGGVDEAANKQDEMIDKINEVKAAEPDDDGDLEW